MISTENILKAFKKKKLFNNKEKNINKINKYKKIELLICKNGNKNIYNPTINKLIKYGTKLEEIVFLNKKLYKTILLIKVLDN